MKFLAALKFLTVLPIAGNRKDSLEEIGGSLVYYPVVGLVIGLVLAGLYWLLALFLPAAIFYGLLLVVLVAITGGLHLDGLADTCDGMAGHRTAEDRLRIMRDSRVGAFGVIGVSLVILLKYVSLASIPENLAMSTLVIMPVTSRWVMVYAIAAYPYARQSGLGQVFQQGANWRRFAVATVVALVVTLGLSWWANNSYFYLVAIVIMLCGWLTTLALANYLKRKLSGLTGDTYGAINEVVEILVLVLVSMLAQNHWLGLT